MRLPRLSRSFAGAILLLATGCADRPAAGSTAELPAALPTSRPTWTYALGAPVRGDTSQKRIALIFTGGDHGEGTPSILDALAARRLKASFFVTGDFLRKPDFAQHLRRAVADGHYVGPHSDKHLLYAPWEDRSRTLVTRDAFRADLQKNIDDLRALGALRGDDDAAAPVYFIPPFEWYNADQVRWSREMNVVLFNFTPGSGSNRDFAPEGHKAFVLSPKLVDDILAYEQKDPHGLNGFLLLLHLGSQRQDKVHPQIPRLLDELTKRGYQFVRVDRVLP
jgi:peptidoglycan/xylan/chitin deacetylase (PgdA/CDA1 family)